jgi:hypothetical protein
MVLVALSSNGLAMKTTIKNPTLTSRLSIADQVRSGSAFDVADFSEVRHQLIVENPETDNLPEVRFARENHQRRPASSLISSGRLEGAVYWFFSAPALFYLIYLVIRPLIGVVS